MSAPGGRGSFRGGGGGRGPRRGGFGGDSGGGRGAPGGFQGRGRGGGPVSVFSYVLSNLILPLSSTTALTPTMENSRSNHPCSKHGCREDRRCTSCRCQRSPQSRRLKATRGVSLSSPLRHERHTRDAVGQLFRDLSIFKSHALPIRYCCFTRRRRKKA